MDDECVARIAACIMAYLRANRGAVDTVDGVMQFWVGPEQSLGSRELTQAALELLFEEGLVARVAMGTCVLWRAVEADALG